MHKRHLMFHALELKIEVIFIGKNGWIQARKKVLAGISIDLGN